MRAVHVHEQDSSACDDLSGYVGAEPTNRFETDLEKVRTRAYRGIPGHDPAPLRAQQRTLTLSAYALKAYVEYADAEQNWGRYQVRGTKDIRAKSKAITDLEAEGKLMVVGAMYDVSSGKVRFLEI